jgi:hypothetical protein
LERQDAPGYRHDDAKEIEWTPVATAPDQLTAEMWQGALRAQSIPCILAPGDTISFLGVSGTPVGLLVPREMAAGAEAVLADLVGTLPLTRRTIPPVE